MYQYAKLTCSNFVCTQCKVGVIVRILRVRYVSFCAHSEFGMYHSRHTHC
jgi:hypothetical protein